MIDMAADSPLSAEMIAMLQRAKGATISEIVTATAWQADSVRGVISGVLRKSWAWWSSRPRKTAGNRCIGPAEDAKSPSDIFGRGAARPSLSQA